MARKKTMLMNVFVFTVLAACCIPSLIVFGVVLEAAIKAAR